MSSNTTAPYALLAGIKMLLMSPLTGTFRVKNAAFANPEDLPKQTTELKTDEQVERVRRAHLNDMENILPFLTIGLIYVLTNPNPMIAIILFRVAGTVRIIHTIIYAIYPIRQPARAICFFTCFFITIYMAVMCIIRFWFI